MIECLQAENVPVVHTREPGGPAAAERIRSILLDPALTVTPRTELMLYLASRSSNVDLVVRPALENGINVVCERFSDATFAYQIGGRGLPETEVIRADRLATGGLVPDLTILLDLDPQIGFDRLREQGRKKDRIELEEIRFHRRVREKYLQMAESDRRFLVIDASMEQLEQDAVIMDRVIQLISKSDNGGRRL